MVASGVMAAASPQLLAGISPQVSLVGELGVLASALLVIGSVPGLPMLLIWLVWRARNTKHPDQRRRRWRHAALAIAAYVFLAFVPAGPAPRLVQSTLFRWWLEYFSVSVAYRSGEPLRRSQYLFLMLPHGLYPFSGACAGISKMAEVFFGMRLAVAPIGLRIPLVRHLMAWIGCIGADRNTVAKALREGCSVGLYPGGVAEMVRTDTVAERLVLKDRKGFVQLALEHGVSIVPVYCFGNSVLWSQFPLPAVVERLSRWLRASLILPYGRLGLLLPRKRPLLFAFGAPIQCPKPSGSGPSVAQIDATHAAVIDAVRELYDLYKGSYGWHERPLHIE